MKKREHAANSHNKRKVGLIVEGDTEYYALPLLEKESLIAGCPSLPAKNLGGVGSDRTARAIADISLPKIIAHQEAQCQAVVLCFDRESRVEPAQNLASAVLLEIRKTLTKKGRQADNVFVVVADRAYEAWLIAGSAGLHRRGTFVRRAKRCFEGESGKQQKKGVVELSELLGKGYRKTDDGVRLFRLLDFSEARDHGSGKLGSASLDLFLRTIGV